MNTITLKSISQMNPHEINQFPVEKDWVQNRTLARQKTSTEEVLFGGGKVSSYEEVLGGLFAKSIQELKENDTYVDSGTGDGNALMEYREIFPHGANVIGIASTQPHDLSKVINKELADKKFSFYLSDFNNFPTESLAGRVSLLSDVKGAFRYSLYPQKVIQQMGKLLKTDGLAFIEMGYGIGIKPDMVTPEKNYLNSRQFTQGSNMLLHLWFQTIKGFDVIQHKKKFENIEKSIEINKEIIKNPHKWDDQMSDNQLIILRRNGDPVQVEPLTYDAEFLENWQRSEKKYWDGWAPRYKWEMSDESKELTKKIYVINQ